MVAATDSKGGVVNGAVNASKDVKGDARATATTPTSGNSRISLGSSTSAVATGAVSATNQSVAKPATASGATNATERSSMSKPEIKSDIKLDKAPTAKETAKESVEQKAKLKAIEQAMGQIEKAYGKGSIMRLDGDLPEPIQGISTGALSLDLALGGRGLPRGRVVEIFGPESSGKTTLALTAIANTQREGGVAAFIDAEHALDPSWAKRLGVNLDEILVSQPDTGEQALEICEMLVRSNAVNMVVIDSVAALIPRAEIEGEMGDSHMGLQARLMSQALRKLTGAIAKSDCIVVFINQLREKIGVMFGSPETTTGGRALKFYATVRIDIRRIGQIKEGAELWAIASRPKWSRIRSRRRSARLNSTSCLMRVFPHRAMSWTWPPRMKWWIRAVPGLATEPRDSVKAVKAPSCSCARIRRCLMRFARPSWRSVWPIQMEFQPSPRMSPTTSKF